MQQRGAGLGSAFGGGDGTVHYERRGSEKTLFHGTLILAISFVAVTILPMLINSGGHVSVPVEITPFTEESTSTANALEGIEITTEDGKTTEVGPTNTLDLPTDWSVDNSDEKANE